MKERDYMLTRALTLLRRGQTLLSDAIGHEPPAVIMKALDEHIDEVARKLKVDADEREEDDG
jgi:hypothetical protein